MNKEIAFYLSASVCDWGTYLPTIAFNPPLTHETVRFNVTANEGQHRPQKLKH